MARNTGEITALVIIFVVIALGASIPAVHAQQPTRLYPSPVQRDDVRLPVLQGHVFEGQMHDTSRPLARIEVSLQSSSVPGVGPSIKSVFTDQRGFYRFEVVPGAASYVIRIRNPGGFIVQAHSIGGRVMPGGAIVYDGPGIERKVGTGNMFFLQRRYGRPQPTPAPTPTPMFQAIPDLGVAYVDTKIESNGWMLRIRARVFNVGNGTSGPTFLELSTPSGHSNRVPVPSLLPGQNQWIEVPLEIPQHWRGTRMQLLIVVDPHNQIHEINERNNSVTTGPIFFPRITEPTPPFTPTPPPGPQVPDHFVPFVPIDLVIIIGTLIGAVVVLRTGLRIHRRSRWKRRAEEEQFKEPCQPCTWRCRKIRIELKPSTRKLKQLRIMAAQPVSGDTRQIEVEREFINELNKVIKAYRHGKKLEHLDNQITQLTLRLLQEIRDWMLGFGDGWNLSVNAHLKGGTVKCEFVLYHCKRRRGKAVWMERDKWKAKVEDERDERFLSIPNAGVSHAEFIEQYTQPAKVSLIHLVEVA